MESSVPRPGQRSGKSLGDYINSTGCDYVNARKIINGTDQASTIAGYAKALEKMLRSSCFSS